MDYMWKGGRGQNEDQNVFSNVILHFRVPPDDDCHVQQGQQLSGTTGDVFLLIFQHSQSDVTAY